MAVPRPVLIAVVGAAAAAGLFFYTQSANRKNIQPEQPVSAAKSKKQTPVPGETAKKGAGTKTDASKSKTNGKLKSGSDKNSGKGDGSNSRSGTSPVSVPPAVARAMVKHEVVVVLFWSHRGADDREVKKAVDRVRSTTSAEKVAVFVDSPKKVAEYSLISGSLGVGQSPALVVVDRARKSRIVSGYIDYTSILQMVRDAERVHAG